MLLHLFEQDFLPLPLYFVSISSHHRQEPVNRVGGFCDIAQVLFVLDGEGYVRCKGEELRLKRGNAFFLDCGVPHAYGGDESFTTAWVTFRGSALEDIRRYIGGRDHLFFESCDLKRYVARLEEIEREYYDGKREGRMSAMVYSLVLSFLDEMNRRERLPMERILRYMEENFHRHITVSELAAVANFSKSTLCNHFKNTYGCTAFEKLMEIRLINAQMMLRLNEDDKVCHIAKRCGFDDVGYFCKAYKKKYGVTPSEYRLS